MAITINNNPSGVQPVYQPFSYKVTSTNVAQPQFRYVFDVYVNDVFVERVRQLANPSDNTATFSPNKILENSISYDIAFHQTLPGLNTNTLAKYSVKFGEEYGAVTSAPVTYSGLTTATGLTFNGVAQYEQYYAAYNGTAFDYNFLKDVTSNGNYGQFLTNAPSTQYYTPTDRGTLSVFNVNSSDTTQSDILRAEIMQVTTYQESGGTKNWLIRFPFISATTIGYKVIHFPTGPVNINGIHSSYVYSGSPVTPIINTTTDYQYTVRLFSYSAATLTGVPVTETITFVEQDCSKYDNVRLAFVNRFGVFDFFNFNKVKRTIINTDKSTFKKNIPLSFYLGTTIGSRETTVYNSKNDKTITANSNWINDEEATWLSELFTSPEVYELAFINGNYTLLPVVVKTSTWENKTRLNDQIFNCTIEYTYASLVNSQRG